MRVLTVNEKIRLRVRYGNDGWSEWQDTTDDFETACEKAKAKVQDNIAICIILYKNNPKLSLPIIVPSLKQPPSNKVCITG